ncbi:MAG: dockerin type I repeat-containing protein [Prevotellaceae bacterium]|nr:dockerin type I repeat-containing protein [Prevotellaceae bacterium]
MKKKIFMLAVMLTVVMFSQVRADSDVIEPDENDKAILTCAVGSSDDLTMIPVTIFLSNSIDITAVEGCVRLPNGLGPDKIVYSEDDEDFVYDKTSRWKKTHTLTAFAGTETHGQDAFFFSIVNSKSANFNDTEGAIVTFYFDGNELADGDYEVNFFDAISVWTDKVNTTTYKSPVAKCTFRIAGGKAIDDTTLVKIAKLEALVASAQTLCSNAVEGTTEGKYAPGAKAAFQDVIDEISANIYSFSDEEIAQATTKLNDAIENFECQKVYENYVYPANVETSAGKQVELPMLLKNTAGISDLQFDLYLPEGVSVAMDEDGLAIIEVSDERTSSKRHAVDYFVRSDGSIRVLCTSSKGLMFNGNEGSVVVVTLNVDSNLAEGEYPVSVKDIVMSNADNVYTVSKKRSMISIVNYVLGDVNADRDINVGDLSRLSDMILNDYSERDNAFMAADINEDNTLNVGDYSELVEMVLNVDEVSASTTVSNDNYLTLGEKLVFTGRDKVKTTLNLVNANEISDLQFDLVLPEGITLASDENGNLMIAPNTNRADKTNYNINYVVRPDGSVRITCTSMEDVVFSGNDGGVVDFYLNVAKELDKGEYPIIIKNGVVSNKDNTYVNDVKASTIEVRISGDSNGDDIVNSADVVSIFNVVSSASTAEDALGADVNGDGVVNSADAVAIYNIISGGGANAPSFVIPSAWLEE